MFIRLTENIRKKKLSKQNEDYDFLKGSFIKRNNVRPQYNLDEKDSFCILKDDFSSRADPLKDQMKLSWFFTKLKWAGLLLPNQQYLHCTKTAGLVTFTEKTSNGNFHFLCSAKVRFRVRGQLKLLPQTWSYITFRVETGISTINSNTRENVIRVTHIEQQRVGQREASNGTWALLLLLLLSFSRWQK